MRKTLSVALIFSILGLFLISMTAKAAPVVASLRQQADEKVVVYVFWGEGCPHCAKAIPYLKDLVQQHPSIDLQMFEVYNVEANRLLFEKFGESYGFKPRYVPTIFIGDKYWEGWSDQIQQDVTSAIETCLTTACPDKGSTLIAQETAAVQPTATLKASISATPQITPAADPNTEEDAGGETIQVPLIGKIDLSHQSLFLSTLLISFVDGFNPCSLWVLGMLLAITLHTGSRKKVLIIGLVFLTVTAGIYALFIAGLFTVFTVVKFVGWIQIVVALVAMFFGLVNIKDYFYYKEGVSFTIADEKKPGLYQKMRKVMDAGDSFWGLIGGTIVLSAGVSLVEFSCTAGFPVLWTNLLAAQNVAVITFVLLLIVYMFIYQLDELGIFLVAVFTLRSSKLEEKHGRILKLTGGVLMLTLAVVMLVKPEIMSNLGQSLMVFGAAFAVTIIVLLLHRVILPRMGIHIGSEFDTKTKKRRRK